MVAFAGRLRPNGVVGNLGIGMAYTGVRTLPVMVNSLQRRRASAVLFSLITACLLGFGGLLVGMSLWRRFGPPARDPDDTDAYLFGLLV
ncbi:MAG: hypothetical protein DMG38_15900 [Acidobacteria bacterium]|nr:MAG: hypothetical protein DMG38_15900 [Acidobacteriota bacterium]